jgi:hypothetical protein
MTVTLKVGAGRSVITPPVGTILYGYAPGRPAETIHDDLRVTCVALMSEQTRALLISADICTYNADSCNKLRQILSSETDIPADHILFCSTHTHSGPATSPSAGWGTVDTEYIQDILIPQTIRAAKSACSNLQPAVLGIGTTQSDVAVNRRQINRDGTIALGQNPWGPYDPIMTVLCFRTPAMEPIVNLIHYCCHGTASGKNPEVTRDWSGPMVDCLEEQSGAMTVFFNGAEGDVGPRLPNGKTTGNLKLAQLLGAKAGIDAVRAWRGIKEYRAVAVNAITDEIRLPYLPLPTLEAARTEMDKLGDPDQLVGMDLKKYVRWQKVIDEHQSGQAPQEQFCFRQTLVAIGPVVLIPFPFEVFMEITLRIRHHSSYQHSLCLSNSNGSYGYFPTRAQYSRGGYEITVARFFNTYALTEDADDAAVNENLRLIEALKQA